MTTRFEGAADTHGPLAGAKRGKLSKRAMKTFNYTDMGLQNTPRVVLTSLNGSFQTRTLELFEPVQVGRRVNTNTRPAASNAVFDSKVLSRTHALVFHEGGKVFVRDTKSSNGTFVNGRRLSADGEESEPMELHDGDRLEFGMDVEENGVVEHQCVSCRVAIVSGSDLDSPSAATRPQRDDLPQQQQQGSIRSNAATSTSSSISPGSAALRSLSALESEISALEQEQRAVLSTIETTRTVPDEEAERLAAENRDLKELVASKDTEVKEQRAELAQLTRENTELRTRASKAEREVTALKDQFSQDRKAQNAAASTVKENKDRIQVLLARVAELERTADAKDNELRGALDRERALGERLEHMQRQLAQSEQQHRATTQGATLGSLGSLDSLDVTSSTPTSAKGSVRRKGKRAGRRGQQQTPGLNHQTSQGSLSPGNLSRAGSEAALLWPDETAAGKPPTGAGEPRWSALRVLAVVAFGLFSIGGFAYLTRAEVNAFFESSRTKVLGN